MSHLPIAIDISRQKRPRGGKELRQRKKFSKFQGRVTESIVPENSDQIRKIKNVYEFLNLFEFLLEQDKSMYKNPFLKN